MCGNSLILKKCRWEAVVKLLFVLWKNISIRALVRLVQKGSSCVLKALYVTIRPGISRSTFLWGKLRELKELDNSSIGTQSIYCSSHNCLWDKAKPFFSLSFLQQKTPCFSGTCISVMLPFFPTWRVCLSLLLLVQHEWFCAALQEDHIALRNMNLPGPCKCVSCQYLGGEASCETCFPYLTPWAGFPKPLWNSF